MNDLLFALVEQEEYEILLEEAMNEYGQSILQLVYSYVRNSTVSEDLTQEIFVKFYNSLSTYSKQSSLKTWLWRIAINHCKDYLKSWYVRKMQFTEHIHMIFESSKEMIEEEMVKKEESEELVQTVMSLPLKYRELIYLHYFEEYTIKEIAELLSINSNTIKTRLRRGKELLKQMIEEG
ncbi:MULTISPECIES: sigma-70 family RNA polymerase sigma factor [Priestia]|uniref:Sigma-70 family RNA polymerase sigma factor n=1 Tax=Priestia aryabhattai TaxID=412384 RepID=A0ABD5KX46_PRIAR|nr:MULTISPECIES: sigma-70 family RNA polymerase sigma factor [Priestia]MBK0293573.1 sigma-70 family RNA polymerase sigma factor [Bacillus sp. S34]UPK52196.1 sigma-70 family RNA polymerase sigma factor [Bacillus sp. H8-1]AWD67739.1 RNA polymerase factor sigma C [Priestia megaterium]MDC7764813.1 sigma-70 family RNA polymerase sigma factor [Priestia aryabhattai]MEB4868981.1 sigma-70 family RNA polymerase sigma factor [Priestia megaterium]